MTLSQLLMLPLRARLLLALLLAALLSLPAAAQTVSIQKAEPASAQTATIEKAEPPAALTPIAVHAVGRTVRTPDGMYTFQWPGTYFVAAFEGPALYFRVGTGRQHLRIVVDGKPSTLLLDGSPATYRIATPTGSSHVARIDVINENMDAPKSLGAFAVPAVSKTSASSTLGNKRQIEFIGDSHTVGYGNTSATHECTPDQVWATTDASQSLGADVARHYHADFQLIAISGRGVVRNYNGIASPLLPEAYPYTLLNSQQNDMRHTYADPTWNPSVIALSLGTNDFSTDLHAGEPWKTRDDLHTAFEQTYAAFIRSLRAAHPHALIILWSTDMVHEEIANEARKVVDTLRTAGDKQVDFLEVPGLTFTACHFHPSTADDATIATKLIADIDPHKNVW